MAKTVECVTCKKMFDPRGIKSHRQTAHGDMPAASIPPSTVATEPASKSASATSTASSEPTKISEPLAKPDGDGKKSAPTPAAKPSGSGPWWDPFGVWTGD
jgi:hypothetical protein